VLKFSARRQALLRIDVGEATPPAGTAASSGLPISPSDPAAASSSPMATRMRGFWNTRPKANAVRQCGWRRRQAAPDHGRRQFRLPHGIGDRPGWRALTSPIARTAEGIQRFDREGKYLGVEWPLAPNLWAVLVVGDAVWATMQPIDQPRTLARLGCQDRSKDRQDPGIGGVHRPSLHHGHEAGPIDIAATLRQTASEVVFYFSGSARSR